MLSTLGRFLLDFSQNQRGKAVWCVPWEGTGTLSNKDSCISEVVVETEP